MRTYNKSSIKAFTLIELLVVIAIIALLVSILMPSLAKAKDLAKTATCMNNMHGTWAAFAMYGNDYEDQMPPMAKVLSSSLGEYRALCATYSGAKRPIGLGILVAAGTYIGKEVTFQGGSNANGPDVVRGDNRPGLLNCPIEDLGGWDYDNTWCDYLYCRDTNKTQSSTGYLNFGAPFSMVTKRAILSCLSGSTKGTKARHDNGTSATVLFGAGNAMDVNRAKYGWVGEIAPTFSTNKQYLLMFDALMGEGDYNGTTLKAVS